MDLIQNVYTAVKFWHPSSIAFFLVRMLLVYSAVHVCRRTPCESLCCVHLLIISSFSCVFPLPPITMATSQHVLRRVCIYYREGRKKRFLIFPYSRCSHVTFGCMKAVCLPSQWRGSHLLEKGKKNNKKKRTFRQSAHKQSSTTSHHLPTACNADTVWGAVCGAD